VQFFNSIVAVIISHVMTYFLFARSRLSGMGYMRR
jgi:uncharacterized membrane protein